MSLGTNELLQSNATTGDGTAKDILAVSRELKFYIIGSAGVTAGAVMLEEAHDAGYTGTWAPLEAPINVDAAAVVTRARSGCFRAVRARITTTVEGGTVTVMVMGNKEP